MKVLGIDPGTKKVGYALLEETSAGFKRLASGTLVLGEGEVLDRLIKLQSELRCLVKEFKPDQIAFESLIYVKSPTALIKLSMAKGVMLGVIAENYQGKIFEYKPNLVKQVTTGYGHADKLAAQKMMQVVLGEHKFSSFDESDATAIALCHLLLRKNPSLKTAKLGKKVSGRKNSLAAALNHRVEGQV